MHSITARYEFLMKPKESVGCPQTISAQVGSGNETTSGGFLMLSHQSTAYWTSQRWNAFDIYVFIDLFKFDTADPSPRERMGSGTRLTCTLPQDGRGETVSWSVLPPTQLKGWATHDKNMCIVLFVGTLELRPSTNQPTNQTISVCSMEKWYFRITSNSKVEEEGYVYLVSVEVPAGTEEKRWRDDGGLYVNCDGMCLWWYVSVRISLFAYAFKCV